MGSHVGSGELSRRQLLHRVGGAAGALVVSPGLAMAIPRHAAKPGRRVAVLGGGMGGLAVAHELAERGFRVTVYERKALGGKARSMGVQGTAKGSRRPLPGEHGFRFFPGFYHHVPDSMRRIPYKGNANGVWDNLVAATEGKTARTDGRPDGQLFGVIPDPGAALTVDRLRALVEKEIVEGRMVPPHEAAYFAERLAVFLTSSDERRYGQWEHTSWWDFVGAESRSAEYQKVVARGLTRTVVAAKEEVASTRTIGNMGEAFAMNAMGRGNDGALDRVLDAPTNEAWINPWVRHLRSLGVEFEVGQTVRALELRGGRVRAALARDRAGRERAIEADWFACAMPVERARRLLSRRVLAADPSLEGLRDLHVDWMNGIQFYLRRPIDLTHGHITFADAPWALTALTQAQFWAEREFAADYGDGTAVDCLSVDISDWDTPGILYGRPAKRCRNREVTREVWAQLKSHLEDDASGGLDDEMLHSWFLDPAIKWSRERRRNTNAEPLLVNTIGSWESRPEARTRIANLVLAGDYVRTDVDLATMEGANESGRAAANAILEAAGSKAEPATMYQLYDPPEFEAAKRIDAERFRAGQPHALDVG
jgi:uncharacterized protein with NAD-binding domain and iron-sulfur cluster